MKHGSLFSGIGGFDLAAQWMGWENVFHCEWKPFGQKILKHYWPKAISYEDITKTDFSVHRGTIDILTGGFPCQPYSTAGKRKGTADDRHLWPEMLRAIREIQPRYIVGENVRGLTNWNGGLVFDQVQAEMESEGYQCLPFLLPACAVNAPHRRDRVWFVAHRNICSAGTSGTSGCIESNRSKNNDEPEKRGITGKQCAGCCEVLRSTSDTKNIGQESSWPTRERGTGFKDGNSGVINPNATSKQLQRRGIEGILSGEGENPEQRFANMGNVSKPGEWQNFPTQSPIRYGDDGLSARLDGITFPKWRNESIKGGGSAIVPQVAFQIFKAIEATLTNE